MRLLSARPWKKLLGDLKHIKTGAAEAIAANDNWSPRVARDVDELLLWAASWARKVDE